MQRSIAAILPSPFFSHSTKKNSVFDATISKMRQICCTHKSLSETPSEPIFGQVEASTLTALIVRNFSAKNEVNRPAASRNMTFQILPMKILHDPSYDQQGTGGRTCARPKALHAHKALRGNKICDGDTKTPASSTHGTRSKSLTANPTMPTKTRTQNQELQLGKQEFHSPSFANAWRPTRSQIILRRCLHLRSVNAKRNNGLYHHPKHKDGGTLQ